MFNEREDGEHNNTVLIVEQQVQVESGGADGVPEPWSAAEKQQGCQMSRFD